MPPTIEELLERIERLEARVLDLSRHAHYHYESNNDGQWEEFRLMTEDAWLTSPDPGPPTAETEASPTSETSEGD